ncbi:glucosaminidase domain-containing protein [Fodinicurvata halophila]|uniref:Glucosaminidase domain-containing protein n=1 Tax=Fodinicurvata halophila TaxID=1419723 RepID=A0ABV8UL46_9PROT
MDGKRRYFDRSTEGPVLGLVLAAVMTALFAQFETDTGSDRTASLDLPEFNPVETALAEEGAAPPPRPGTEPQMDPSRQTAYRNTEIELPDLDRPDFRNIEILAPASTRDLQNNFARVDYKLAEVREGRAEVPRLYVTGLPRDLDNLSSVDDKKRAFLRSVLPLVLLANQEIEAKREHMIELLERQQAGGVLDAEARAWLDELARQYGVEDGNTDILKRRVDVLPVSLALAQAIVESGWGTSRFAVEGNALFGQRSWGESTEALIPDRDRSVRVRAFEDLMDSVRAYMHNLNTHPAYREFRRNRAETVARKDTVDGYDLAANLEDYAEINNYVEKLRGLIRSNRLQELEEARLDDGGSFYARLHSFETRR